eukprot:112220-Rhodomonas_salina.1
MHFALALPAGEPRDSLTVAVVVPPVDRVDHILERSQVADDDCGDFFPPTLRKNYAPFFVRLQSESIPNVLPQRCSSSARDSDDLSVP